MWLCYVLFFNLQKSQSIPLDILLKDFIYLFFKQGEGEENEKERNIGVREKRGSVALVSAAPPVLDTGLQPQPQLFTLWDDAQPNGSGQGVPLGIFATSQRAKEVTEHRVAGASCRGV